MAHTRRKHHRHNHRRRKAHARACDEEDGEDAEASVVEYETESESGSDYDEEPRRRCEQWRRCCFCRTYAGCATDMVQIVFLGVLAVWALDSLAHKHGWYRRVHSTLNITF